MGNGFFDAGSLIKPNQARDVVLGGESFNEFFAVLINSPNQIVGHANVKGAFALARKNIDKEGHEQRLKAMRRFVMCQNTNFCKQSKQKAPAWTPARRLG